MNETDLTPPRAVAIGLPERLRNPALENLPNVLVVGSLAEAAAVLDANPRAVVLYGDLTFGAVVSGQPVFLLPQQRDGGVLPQVMVMIDCSPRSLASLEWDDPRRLARHAGTRLAAKYLVDVSEPGAWGALSELIDEQLAHPPAEGVSSVEQAAPPTTQE